MEEEAEDIFGHGGSLDEPPPGLLAADGIEHDDTAADADRHGAAPPTQPAPTASRRRKRSDEHCAPADFTERAIRQLGESLNRRDTDAAGRMLRLRRRVREKERAAVCAIATPAVDDRDRPSADAAHGHGSPAPQRLPHGQGDDYIMDTDQRAASPRARGLKRGGDQLALCVRGVPGQRSPRRHAHRRHLGPALPPERRGSRERDQRAVVAGSDALRAHDRGGNAADPRPEGDRASVRSSSNGSLASSSNGGKGGRLSPRDGTAGIGGAYAPASSRACVQRPVPGGAGGDGLTTPAPNLLPGDFPAGNRGAASDVCGSYSPAEGAQRPTTRAELIAALEQAPQRPPVGLAPTIRQDRGLRVRAVSPGGRTAPMATAQGTNSSYASPRCAAGSTPRHPSVYSTAAVTSAAVRGGSEERRDTAAASSEPRPVLLHSPAEAGKRRRAAAAIGDGENSAVRRRIRGKQPPHPADAHHASPRELHVAHPRPQLGAVLAAQPAHGSASHGLPRSGRPPDWP